MPSSSGNESIKFHSSSTGEVVGTVTRSAVDAKWVFNSFGSARRGWGLGCRILCITCQISLGLDEDSAF